jgi:hypothetical protein
MLAKLTAAGFEVHAWNNAAVLLRHALPTCEAEIEAALAPLTISMADLIAGGGGLSSVAGQLRKKFNALHWRKGRFEIWCRAYDTTKKKAKTELRRFKKPIHEIDHTKSFVDQVTSGKSHLIGLEIEWNSKDSVFYRDLSNLKFLYDEQLISLGVIVTRGKSLQRALPGLVKAFAKKYGIASIKDIHSRSLYDISKKAEKAIAKKIAAGANFEDAWSQQFVQSKFGTTTTHAGKLMKQIERGAGGLMPLVLIGIPARAVTV